MTLGKLCTAPLGQDYRMIKVILYHPWVWRTRSIIVLVTKKKKKKGKKQADLSLLFSHIFQGGHRLPLDSPIGVRKPFSLSPFSGAAPSPTRMHLPEVRTCSLTVVLVIPSPRPFRGALSGCGGRTE